jgi:hypothetical protein
LDDDTDRDGSPDYLDPDQFVFVKLKAFLQGSYDRATGLMNDLLRSKGLIPTIEPFTNLSTIAGPPPFVHTGKGGGEVIFDLAILDITGNNAIVDWVFLEIRNAVNPVQVLESRAALIQADGDIVDVDGVSPVYFPTLSGSSFHISIRHRNHLGMMTREPINFTNRAGTTPVVDFTNPATPTFGRNALKIDAATNKALMWGGNADANHYIVYQGSGIALPDGDLIFFDVFFDPGNTTHLFNFIRQGYYNGDTNMDGEEKYQGLKNDIDALIFTNILEHPGNVESFLNFFIIEQLPEVTN